MCWEHWNSRSQSIVDWVFVVVGVVAVTLSWILVFMLSLTWNKKGVSRCMVAPGVVSEATSVTLAYSLDAIASFPWLGFWAS